ncbi:MULTISPECIES: YdiU family protein [unclassified Ectothiorhodospira]|uniref:protein adenylyltransferase SelO n=1 Tax=unclassified Ectothiorhodospira TaxID=2684909 RepID=UPI001EE92CF5|nr:MULTISPECIES: YdiU family protein [unclassified Ectothiorhodospira]MCG5516773.1 YdiU family protein [Ectothiorhodospira sp. 9100]MCG5518568.1 YdiU family protein [Ectothiorhodospira sp. 9905]
MSTAPVLESTTSPVTFDNRYARLPKPFFVRMNPTPVASPRLRALNTGLCGELGIDPGALSEDAWAQALAGNAVLPGSEPLAMAYAGHQFGHFVPQLGDGRALLLGEVVDRAGVRRDIQLKGAGPTPFSRMGDGRAALGPVLREYLLSEAMHAMGVSTTRALAMVTTGETVYREEPLPGAVLTRVAQSHIRVGTFQFFAARRDPAAVKSLADHVIERHYPEVRQASSPYLALLESIAGRQAELVARWMLVGFIHGVMNTDNMAVSGETIDYGPCAFMDTYHPGTVFSSIDQRGRYAFANQPEIAQWNLARLAETLLPLIDDDASRAIDQATQVLEAFPSSISTHWLAGMRDKLGLQTKEDSDLELVRELLDIMRKQEADFTLTFRYLSDLAAGEEVHTRVRSLFNHAQPFDVWLPCWQARVAREPHGAGERGARMRRVNPGYIPRNHRVEQAIRAAVSEADFGPFEHLLGLVTQPFQDHPGQESFMQPARPEERVHQTFCGT